MFVFFLTDIFFFGVLTLLILYSLYVYKTDDIRLTWVKVFSRKSGIISSLVLILFLLITAIDSIHFKKRSNNAQTSEVISLLDYLMEPIYINYEKSYSAPFSSYLYSKETVINKEGKEARVFSPLKYKGDLKNNVSNRLLNVILVFIKAFFISILIISMILLSYLYFVSRLKLGSIINIKFTSNEKVFFVTLNIIIFLLSFLYLLSLDYYILGTDKIGLDVFYKSIKSIRTGIIIGTLTTIVMLPFAIFLGIAAGYLGGLFDDLIQYLYTTINSIPSVLLVASAILMLQVYMSNNPGEFQSIYERADLRLFFLCLILGLTSWTGLCRLLRAESLKLKSVEYIKAAEIFGLKRISIIVRHFLPNLVHIVLITIVLDFSGLVLAEAVLSYVNIGVDPTTYSWGNMINAARLELSREPIVWWSLTAAFIFMFILVLFANLFADNVRDAFDPRAKINE